MSTHRQDEILNLHQHTHHDNQLKDCRCMKRSAKQDIALSTIGLVAPMILLTTILLTFVLLYRVDNSTVLPVGTKTIESNAIYVNANSTLLIFVSSWMSSIVPFLTAFAIALSAYPIAQRLLQDSIDNKHDSLMTALELSIAIKFMNGSIWSSLWNFFRYSTCRNKKVARHHTALVSITIVTVMVAALGLAVVAADTWLHVATESVNLIRLSELTPEDALYSFTILPQCTATNNSFTALKSANLSCAVSTRLKYPDIQDKVMALQVLSNQSDTLAVLPVPHIQSMHYLSLVSTAVNASYDYQATTFAVSTECMPITSLCNLSITTQNTTNATWNCNNGSFTGTGESLLDNGVLRQSYRYANMTGTEGQWPLNGVNNPFYTAGAAFNQLSTTASSDQKQDSEIVVSQGTSVSAIFLCSSTVYDVLYQVSEGQAFNFTFQPSDNSVTNLFASGVTDTQFGWSNADIDLDIAAPNISSAQEYADVFANHLSKVALASGATAVQLTPIITGYRRDPLIVSKVPKAPLFLLVGLNLSFVVLGAILATVASLTSHEARDVQFRLSITGIIANVFGGLGTATRPGVVNQFLNDDHGSEKDMRLKIHRTSTGEFVFRSVEDVNEIQNHSLSIYIEHDHYSGGRGRGRGWKSDGLLVTDREVDPMI